MSRLLIEGILPKVAFLMLLSITRLIAFPVTSFSQSFIPSQWLPKGSRLAKITVGATETDWEKTRKNLTDAVFLDPWEEFGGHQAIVYYTVGDSAVVSLYRWNPVSHRFVVAWRQEAEGVLFDSMSGVWDINGDGRKEVVALRWIGASAGGTLDIFAWDGTGIKRISPHIEDITGAQLVDIKKTGQTQVLVNHRFGVPSVYRWNGTEYNIANQDFPEIYQAQVDKYMSLALNPSLTPTNRAEFTYDAAMGLIFQKRYDEAIALCNRTIEDQKIKNDRIASSVVYKAFGEIHLSKGEYNEARASFERSIELSPSREVLRKLNELKKPTSR